MHIPVLYNQVLDALNLHDGGRYIDGTLGWGGHSAGILERTSPNGQLLAIDQDPMALAAAQEHVQPFQHRVTFARGNFRDLAAIATQHGWHQVDGILLDIGVSSPQLDRPERGFSFQHDAPLDMRMNPDAPQTAADLVNSLDEESLANVIYEYGEERLSRRIARRIIEQRRTKPFTTTGELANLLKQVVGGKSGGIHPATRTFQALRIAVNDELAALRAGLSAATDLLALNGRLAVITFHSLEDRIVKEFMRREASECLIPPKIEILACPHSVTVGNGARRCIYPVERDCDYAPRLAIETRKPIEASDAEVATNPRARSAKLRVARRLEAVGDRR